MNKFFTSQQVYEDRLAICRACDYYFKPTGSCGICKCFMRIKCRLAPMECPKKFWTKTTVIEIPEDLPQELIDEILDIWKYLKTGVAEGQDAKIRMMELYNTITASNYNPRTSCGSCLSTAYDAIKKLYIKYNKI